MTCASALVVAGQDARWHHIGIGTRGGPAAAGLLPVSLLAQQRLIQLVDRSLSVTERPADRFPIAESAVKSEARPTIGAERRFTIMEGDTITPSC